MCESLYDLYDLMQKLFIGHRNSLKLCTLVISLSGFKKFYRRFADFFFEVIIYL